MTIAQAHKEFQLFLDKVDSQALPDFLPQEIDIFLHEAELRIVKSYTSIKEDQRLLDKLSGLYKTSEITCTSNEATLPTDYLSYIRCKVQVSNDKITPVYTSPFMCPQGKLESVLSDPFNKSRIAYPVIYQEDGKIKVDTDGGKFTANKVLLTYIKYPVKVNKLTNVSSELSETLQKEAIQLAVALASESVHDPSLQTKVGLLPTTK